MLAVPDIAPPQSRPAAGIAFWHIGFRPFYLLATVFAAITISCRVAQFAGWTGAHMIVAGPLWHAHEMIFGYAFAFILLVVHFGPMLLKPRVDGRDGQPA